MPRRGPASRRLSPPPGWPAAGPTPRINLQTENWGADVPGLTLDSFATIAQTVELGGKRSARRGAAEAAADMARADAFVATRAIEREMGARFLEAVRLRDRVGILAGQRDALAELATSRLALVVPM